MSDDRRNETQIIADILGLETLVDEITNNVASESGTQPTATAILGPFWRRNATMYKNGDSIVQGFPDADHTYIHGTVLDFSSGKPIPNAELDVWHTAPNGLYENQDPDQPDMNLRGRFYTDEDGRYGLYCLRPTKYPVPDDGPGGELLKLLDRHPWRPAHIHFIISADEYQPLVTQIFDRRDEYLHDDATFAVKDELVVEFLPREGDLKAQFELSYDFRLVSVASATNHA